MMRNRFNKQQKSIFESIDIINAEGGILKVECVDATKLLFKIVDRYKMTVAFFNKEEILQYLDGASFVRDSKGEQWNVINAGTMFTTKKFILDELIKQGIDLN